MKNRFFQYVYMKPYLILVSLTAATGDFLFGFDTLVVSGAIVSITPKFGLNEFQEVCAPILLKCIAGVSTFNICHDVRTLFYFYKRLLYRNKGKVIGTDRTISFEINTN